MKEQRAAVEMLLAPEAAGKVRPALMVNCCLALAGAPLLLQGCSQSWPEECPQGHSAASGSLQHCGLPG